MCKFSSVRTHTHTRARRLQRTLKISKKNCWIHLLYSIFSVLFWFFFLFSLLKWRCALSMAKWNTVSIFQAGKCAQDVCASAIGYVLFLLFSGKSLVLIDFSFESEQRRTIFSFIKIRDISPKNVYPSILLACRSFNYKKATSEYILLSERMKKFDLIPKKSEIEVYQNDITMYDL